MPKYKVVVECHGPTGTDIHCYTTEGKTDREAADKAVDKCKACYPEYDEITPSRVDYDKANPRAEIWIEEMEDDT